MTHVVKSKRFDVMVPPGVANQILELAADLGTSQSKAILLLILKGLEVVQGSENPLNRKPE